MIVVLICCYLIVKNFSLSLDYISGYKLEIWLSCDEVSNCELWQTLSLGLLQSIDHMGHIMHPMYCRCVNLSNWGLEQRGLWTKLHQQVSLFWQSQTKSLTCPCWTPPRDPPTSQSVWITGLGYQDQVSTVFTWIKCGVSWSIPIIGKLKWGQQAEASLSAGRGARGWVCFIRQAQDTKGFKMGVFWI